MSRLARGDRSHGDGAYSAPDSLARTVSTLLRPPCAAACAADVRAWPVQRQRSEGDAGHGGSRHAAGHLPSLSAFHHARDVGRRSDLAASPRGAARTPRRTNHRWDQFSETGQTFGRCDAPVLRRLGEDCELPSRGDGCALDGNASVADGRVVVSPEALARGRSARGGANPGHGLVPGEVATGADVDPSRACRGPADRGRARRRRVRRRHRLPTSAAPLGPAVCRRRLAPSHRISRHTDGSCAAESAHGPAAIAVGPGGRHPSDRRECFALTLPKRAWRRVTWRNGTNRPWAARFAAVRVTPAHEWRDRRLAPEVWLLCEQDLGATPRTKYFFVNLPATASVTQLVRLAHQRWAIEQQYQELKTELGLDHFEGRSYPGWHHHVVLTAVAYAFLQRERMRSRVDPPLTFPAIRVIVQEIFTALLLAQQPHYFKRIQELQQINLRI